VSLQPSVRRPRSGRPTDAPSQLPLTLAKTSVLTGLATALKLASGLVATKAVSVLIGPAGLALVGQFQNLVAMVLSLSSQLLSQGVVKYAAEFQDQPEPRNRVLRVAFNANLILALGLGAVLIAGCTLLASAILHDRQYWYLFVLLAVLAPFGVVNNTVLSAINGLGQIGRLTRITIYQSIVGLALTLALVWLWRLNGALLSVVLAQTVIFALLWRELRHHPYLRWKRLTLSADGEDLKKLGQFALMAATSAVCIPLTQMVVRDFLARELSWDDAGLWQGITRLSQATLLFASTTLTVYFVPRFARADDRETRREIVRGYMLIVPVLVVLMGGLWLVRDRVILLLYAPEFMPMRDLFAWQFVGDAVKVSSWVLGYILVARARVAAFVSTEIVLAATQIALYVVLVRQHGLVGTCYANLVTYLLNFVILGWFLRDVLTGRKE